jgi:tetratricopeptide (TPR) repeat protein
LDNVKRLIAQGKLDHASSLCEAFCENYPQNIQAFYILTDLYVRTQLHTKALDSILQAELLDKVQPQIQISKIHCLILLGDTANALITANNLLKQTKTLLGKDWLTLGVHFHHLNALLSAHTCFQNAVAQEPNNSQFRFNLATSLRNNGDLNLARLEFENVIKLNPHDWDAYLSRSLLSKASEEVNHIEPLNEQLSVQKNNVEAQIKLRFALGKEFEDCCDYSEAFSNIRTANEQRNRITKYDVVHDIDAIHCISSNFAEHNTRSPANNACNSDEAIFIVGLPRTGTTLLERIISQHSDVFSAGELNNFAICLTQALTNNTNKKINSKIDLITQSVNLDFAQLGESYIDSTRPLTGHTARFIDKMPLNFLYTGLIKRALPNAKIIHLTRSPMATCLAIYKTNFGQAYPFSYDLNNLAQYYIAYRQLMAHWKNLFPDNLLEVNYEELVSESEQTCKNVFSFCKLNWDTKFLQLERNDTPTATASSAQVRGGIYQSSVELWRNYQTELAPLQEQLSLAGIDPEKW